MLAGRKTYFFTLLTYIDHIIFKNKTQTTVKLSHKNKEKEHCQKRGADATSSFAMCGKGVYEFMKCVRFLNRKTGTGAAAILLAASVLTAAPVYAAEDTGLGVDMSTDYPGITVKVGETVSFPLDFISLDGESYDVDLSAGELPENWSGYFKGGSSQITKVHVDGDSKKSDETGISRISV